MAISFKKKIIPKKNIIVLFWRNNLGDKSPKCQTCSTNMWTFLFCSNIYQLIFFWMLIICQTLCAQKSMCGIICTLYKRQVEWGSERWSDFSRVTQLVCGTVKSQQPRVSAWTWKDLETAIECILHGNSNILWDNAMTVYVFGSQDSDAQK